MPAPNFRVWDGKEMIYLSDSVAWSLKIHTRTEWILYYKNRHHCRHSSETALMQHVGLEDVEGEPIFEADILREEETGILSLVWWNRERGRYYLLSPDGDTQKLSRETLRSGQWRVVGNIHETPDLLLARPKPIRE